MPLLESSVSRGFTLLELLFVVAFTAAVLAWAMPLTAGAIDDHRTGMAARYLAARIRNARTDAVKRSAAVALKFEAAADDPGFACYRDGNGDGVRTADIQSGRDLVVHPVERLRDNFTGVRFGFLDGVPNADGAAPSSADGITMGAARILTLSPDGTATSGTLYLRGSRSQYAVRVYGATGRTRVLQYRRRAGTWITR